MSETKRPHGSRFRDALVIVNPGACNPSGIAHSIIGLPRDPRVRAQREHRRRPGDPTDGLSARIDLWHRRLCAERYIADEAACKERLVELGLKPFGSN